jgi:hypothetical protein
MTWPFDSISFQRPTHHGSYPEADGLFADSGTHSRFPSFCETNLDNTTKNVAKEQADFCLEIRPAMLEMKWEIRGFQLIERLRHDATRAERKHAAGLTGIHLCRRTDSPRSEPVRKVTTAFSVSPS